MTDFGRKFTAAAHKTSHQDGGTDEIDVTALSGELGDGQPPKNHALAGTQHTASTLAQLNAKVSNATLDDSSATRTPSAHKTSHQSGGTDVIDVTGLAGVLNYVHRGDPDDWDLIIGDFTTDATWRDIDLHLIVPAGAKAVDLRLKVSANAADYHLSFRKKGLTNALNAQTITTVVATALHCAQLIVHCDTDRFIQYSGANVTFTAIYFLVAGWFI